MQHLNLFPVKLPLCGHSPENTVVPSADQSACSTGCSCAVAALGTDCPFACTSQHLTWLSQDVAMRWFATGLNLRLEMPSVGGETSSTSLFGLC